MKPYEKSYKGLIIWLLAFLVLMIGFPALLGDKLDSKAYILLFLNILSISLTLLTGIIYVTQSIYWYNGMDFEKAKEASPAQRSRYAVRHFQRFGFFACGGIVYSLLSYSLHLPRALDIILFTFGIIVVALSTNNIHLEE